MEIDWSFYWPAVSRRRYWHAAAKIALSGVATAGLVLGLASLAGTAYDKLFNTPGEPGYWTWLEGMRGTAWVALMSSLGFFGTVLYGARRVWYAERDSDVTEALRGVVVELGENDSINGYELFAWYGRLLDTKMSGSDWVEKVLHEVQRTIIGHVGSKLWKDRSHPPMSPNWVASLRTALRRTLEVLFAHGLTQSESPDSVMLGYRAYALNREGLKELQIAEQRVEPLKSRFPG
jgi:hypothetical protein